MTRTTLHLNRMAQILFRDIPSRCQLTIARKLAIHKTGERRVCQGSKGLSTRIDWTKVQSRVVSGKIVPFSLIAKVHLPDTKNLKRLFNSQVVIVQEKFQSCPRRSTQTNTVSLSSLYQISTQSRLSALTKSNCSITWWMQCSKPKIVSYISTT